MITIEQEEAEKEKKRKAGKTNDMLEFGLVKDNKGDGDDDEGGGKKKIGIEADGPSISLKIFLDYTISLADKFKDVNKRLISALGIDTSNENVRIEWDQFLNLKCFLELFTITGDELQNLWLRALDPKGLSLVPLPEFEEFLERIARGSMSNQPTAVSATFSKEMKRLMELEGCIAGE